MKSLHFNQIVKTGLISLFLFNSGIALAGRPNILLITADDMNWDSVGVYGCPVEGTTPNIDRLASEGVMFDYGYVQISLCTPSRQVMLSGSHSHQTMTRCFTELERVGPALPDILKKNGYYIANINKTQYYYEWDRLIEEDITSSGRNIPLQQKLVSEIISDSGDKPWFIMMNFNDPHRPFYESKAEHSSEKYEMPRKKGWLSTPSRVYTPDEITVPGFLPDLPEVRMEMAQYYSSVRRADDGVGAILKALDASGQAKNTIVVFLSDNGISLPFSKMNCYQTSLRVPFIVRYPDHLAAGHRDKIHMVSAVDIAPTLIELSGLDVPKTMAGRSFVPLLKNQPQEGRDYVIGYYYRNLRQTNVFPEFAVHMRDWVYIYNPWVIEHKEVHNSDYTGSPTLLAMWEAATTSLSIKKRTEFHKYRIMEELYNVRQDPHAYINLATDPEFSDRLAFMRKLLVDWMGKTNHPALELMKDPHNEKLIKEYMAWEVENAIKQEAPTDKKENK
jgi:N-sulfoglucosamine sulfohydrolase